eukprot:1442264-Rhodomonas_salina.1
MGPHCPTKNRKTISQLVHPLSFPGLAGLLHYQHTISTEPADPSHIVPALNARALCHYPGTPGYPGTVPWYSYQGGLHKKIFRSARVLAKTIVALLRKRRQPQRNCFFVSVVPTSVFFHIPGV